MRAHRTSGSARSVAATAPRRQAPTGPLRPGGGRDSRRSRRRLFSPSTPRWRFVAFNRAATEIFDLRREERDRPDDLGSLAGRGRDRVRAALSAGDDDAREAGFRNLLDRAGPTAITRSAPFRSATGIGVAFRDVTDRQAMVETLAPARARARAGAADRLSRRHAGRRARRFLWPAAPRNICRSTACRPRRRSNRTRAWVRAPPPGGPSAAIERLFAAVAGGGERIQVGIPHHPAERRRGALDPGGRRRSSVTTRAKRSRWSARISTSPSASSPSRRRSRARRSCGRSPTPCPSSFPMSTATRSSASSTRPTKAGSTDRAARSSAAASTK